MWRVKRWKTKALVCEDFQKAAAWTQTSPCFPLNYLHKKHKEKKKTKKKNLKKKEKRKKAIQLDQVLCSVVLLFSLLLLLKHRG